MTKGNPAWERFEREVQKFLNLRSTLGSGNQWHDISDGVSHPEDSYKLMVDCKHTDGKTYSLNGDKLQAWVDEAAMRGYNFALPVEFGGSKARNKQWVVIPLNDYVELVDAMRDFSDRTE